MTQQPKPIRLPKESTVFTAILLSIVICSVSAYCYLLHRTYEYFGGGALNRPFALTSNGQYAFFALQSFAYALCLHLTLGILLLLFCQRVLRLRPVQALFVFPLIVGSVSLIDILVRFQIYEYFKNEFDLGKLRQLTEGQFFNLLGYVTLERFISFGLVVIAAGFCFFLVRVLGRFNFAIQYWKRSSRFWTVLLTCWGILILNHFAIRNHEALRHGLSSQMPYWLVDFALRQLSDFDRDGFGPLTYPRDPDNFNSGIHLYAVDHPENGIDENGLLGDFIPTTSSAKTWHEKLSNRQDLPPDFNVLLVVVETFRTDVIGMEIDGREVTPFLNSIAQDHFYTDKFYSNFGVTSRAIQSTLFGTLHYTPGDDHLFSVFRDRGFLNYIVSAQNEDWGKTAEIFNMKNADSFYDARLYSWEEDGLTNWEKLHLKLWSIGWEHLNKQIFSTLDKPREKPFFMYVNYQDLHYPYYSDKMERVFIDSPRVDSGFFKQDNRQAIIRQYANASHHLDKGFAHLFKGLEERDLLDSTLIVILGDHPDSFYENGILGHAWTVDEHQRKTPLFLINAAGTVTTPLGQDEIADIIVTSLQAPTQSRELHVQQDPTKQVFMITGDLETPRQIAWIAPESLITFDFKTNRAQIQNQAWRSLEELVSQGESGASLKKLIHYYENLRWLRHEAENP